jgi:phosphate transport system protein
MTPYSPRQKFDRSLQQLLDQVLILGSMVEQAIQQAMDALQRRDLAAARQIYEADQRINEKRYAIEHECVTLIATQQPMARDVRFLAALLEIITELERIGDYAKGICKINLLMSDEPLEQTVLINLQQMSVLGLDMLRRALDAFIRHDAETAKRIPLEDTQVDQLYDQVYRKLMDQMNALPGTIDRGNHLMWAAHNLERMADRVTNICERIVYVVTGEIKELDNTDGIKANPDSK